VIDWPVVQPTLIVDPNNSSFTDSNALVASPQIALRPLREEDIEPIFLACQDPTISAFTRVPYPYDREMAEEFVRGSDISYRAHQGVVFAIEVDGTFAGTIGLHSIQLGDHCAEVGYWMAKEFRGNGLCTVALDLMLNMAQQTMKFRRIEGLADFNNLASQKVMERVGMTRDALLRNRVTKPNGEQIDMVLYSITK
jgi:ribosomal-protein-alanine N-acetyltransferase